MDEEPDLESGRMLGCVFVHKFLKLYHKDAIKGHSLLISVYASCFGLIEPEDRIHQARLLLEMIHDVKDYKFEDALDFLSFVREKQEGDAL